MCRSKVLLVDDMEPNLALFERILADLGVECFQSRSGEEALRLARENDFAAVLLDVCMPKMDGYETAQLLREQPESRCVPIIFVTAAGRERGRELAGYSAGAVDFLFKPIVPTILVSKIKVFVDLNQQRRIIQEQVRELEESRLELKSINQRVSERERHVQSLQQAKSALIASEQQFRALVNNIPGVSYRRSVESIWTFKYLSDAITEYSGHTPSHFVSEHPDSFKNIVHVDDRSVVEAGIDEAVAHQQSYILEYRIVHADGTVRWVRERGQGFVNSLGALCWLDGAIVDVTFEKRTEEELRQAKERAEIASKAQSDFLANMSHELRTPLHGILSFAGFGMKRHATAAREKLCHYFRQICDSGTTLLSLLNDLLDVAKLESGKMSFELQSINLANLCDAMRDEFSSYVSDQGLTIDWSAPDPGLRVRADPERIKQVLRNLLSNAAKFAPEGSEISFEARQEGDMAVISVRDHGPGIPENELESVFDKFVQSSKTTTGAGGTGLGLAICRQIVGAHEGRIWAENSETGGARVTFSLPLSGTRPGSVPADLRSPGLGETELCESLPKQGSKR